LQFPDEENQFKVKTHSTKKIKTEVLQLPHGENKVKYKSSKNIKTKVC